MLERQSCFIGQCLSGLAARSDRLVWIQLIQTHLGRCRQFRDRRIGRSHLAAGDCLLQQAGLGCIALLWGELHRLRRLIRLAAGRGEHVLLHHVGGWCHLLAHGLLDRGSQSVLDALGHLGGLLARQHSLRALVQQIAHRAGLVLEVIEDRQRTAGLAADVLGGPGIHLAHSFDLAGLASNGAKQLLLLAQHQPNSAGQVGLGQHALVEVLGPFGAAQNVGLINRGCRRRVLGHRQHFPQRGLLHVVGALLHQVAVGRAHGFLVHP